MITLFRKFLLYKPVPENSLAFRLATLTTVELGIIAVLGLEEWPSFSIPVILGTVIGFWISYIRRDRRNWWVKIILSLLMVVALANFLTNDLPANPYDPRVPLANLLLWLQMLHSYDLPTRRDLNYSILVGFILMCLAAFMSNDLLYLPYLLGFAFLAILALLLSCRSLHQHKAGVILPTTPARTLAFALAFSMLLIVAASLVFLALPRHTGFKIRPLTISWTIRLPNISRGRLINPAYPVAGTRDDLKKRKIFNQDNYFGFFPYLDLNMRGRLSRKMIMRVRTNHESYYRGIAFDAYTGCGWEFSRDEVRTVYTTIPPAFIPLAMPGDQELVQTFYIDSEQANVIFAAFQPYQLYFPSDTIYFDKDLGLRSPFPLENGMIYSCISLANSMESKKVQQTIKFSTKKTYYWRKRSVLEAYLRLPPISPRVRALAVKLTARYQHPLEKARAICLFLQETFTYDLDIPPFPEGKEVVDYFLFTQKRGYCEHFATSMAVLLRAVGIPTRLITGYSSGTYNPLTGFWEVRSDDAHAWVEVLIPDLGWVPFDPTPGYQPIIGEEISGRSPWIFGDLLKYIRGNLPLDRLASVGRWMMEKGKTVIRRSLPLLGLTLIGIVSGLIAYLVIPSRRRFRRRLIAAIKGMPIFQSRIRESEEEDHIRRSIFAIYRRMCREFSRRGFPRLESQTPFEYASRLKADFPWQEIESLTDIFQEARYSKHEMDETMAKQASEDSRNLISRLHAGPAKTSARTNGSGKKSP